MLSASVILASLCLSAFVQITLGQTATLLGSAYCSNRGGTSSSNVFAINVGTNNLAACTAAVAANNHCSNFFSYGASAGNCDCVPCGQTSCTQVADGGQAAYSIESSYQACPAVSSRSVSIAPATAYETQAPTQLTLSFTTVNGLLSGDTITLGASSPIYVAGSPTLMTCSVMKGGVSDTATFGSAISATDTSTLVATIQGGQSIGTGVAVQFFCTSNLAAHATVGTVISFSLFVNMHQTASGVPGWTTIAIGLVGGDPLTEYGGVKTHFVIPYGTFTPLIQSPDIHVLATPHPGEEGDEQWLSRIRVTTPAGIQLLEVGIKNDLAVFNRSQLPLDAFETMDVAIGPSREPVLFMPPPNEYLEAFGEKILFLFGRMRTQHAITEAPRREIVHVITGSMQVSIFSSSAHEWYTSSPGLALKHAHLDLMFPALHAPAELRGLLPELWGLQPMTEASASTIKNVSVAEQASAAADSRCENLTSKLLGDSTVEAGYCGDSHSFS